MEPPIGREDLGLVPLTWPTGSSPSSSQPDWPPRSLIPTGPNEPTSTSYASSTPAATRRCRCTSPWARPSQTSSISCVDVSGSLALTSSRASNALPRRARGNDALIENDLERPEEEDLHGGNALTRCRATEYGAIPALYLASTDDAHPAPMGTGAPTPDRPSSPSEARRRHVLRPRRTLIFACIAAETSFVFAGGPANHTSGEKCGFTGAPSVVPAGICRIRIEAVGAAGGGEGTAGARRSGVHVVARNRLAPTEILRVRVRGLRGAALGTSAVDAARHGGVAADGAAGHHGKAGSAADIPKNWNNDIRDHTADAAHPTPATPSPAAVTAFYRRAEERTAKLLGKPAPKWRVCPSCKLAFHGPNTLAENPATGHTPGDWQP